MELWKARYTNSSKLKKKQIVMSGPDTHSRRNLQDLVVDMLLLFGKFSVPSLHVPFPEFIGKRCLQGILLQNHLSLSESRLCVQNAIIVFSLWRRWEKPVLLFPYASSNHCQFQGICIIENKDERRGVHTSWCLLFDSASSQIHSNFSKFN